MKPTYNSPPNQRGQAKARRAEKMPAMTNAIPHGKKLAGSGAALPESCVLPDANKLTNIPLLSN